MIPAAASGRFRFAPVLAGTVVTVLLLLLVGRVADVFLLLFISILIALYLEALARVLRERLGLHRRVVFPAAVLLSLAALVGFFWLLVPPVVEQTQALLRVLPSYIAEGETGIERLIARVPALRAVWRPGEHRVLLAVYQQLSGYFSNLVPKLVSVVEVGVSLFSVAIMGIYLATNPGLYREFLIALFPPVHRDLVRNVLGELARTLRAWIVGQILAMIVLAVLTAIGLYVLRVPYWLTFGVFTGVVAIVPYFGTLVSTLLPALFVLGSGSTVRALLVAGLGVIVHLFEANVVAPLIMARQVHLPPVLTILAVLIMGKLLGIIGLLVAVPSLAVLLVVVRRILVHRIYEGQGFRRTVRDSAFIVRAPVHDISLLVSEVPPPDPLDGAEAAQHRAVA